jgi:chromate reductase
MKNYKAGYLVSSLAKASINRKLATALTKLAPEGLTFEEIHFKELPLYSYDFDADYPPVARAFKDALRGVDALLFVTPEYDRSIRTAYARSTGDTTRSRRGCQASRPRASKRVRRAASS